MVNPLLSRYKLLKHLGTLDKFKKKEIFYPKLIRVDLTNSCNHRCTYCMYQKSLPEFDLCDDFSSKDFIHKEKMLDLIEEFANNNVSAIMFTGGGEPTIHPDIYEIIYYTLEKGIEVGLLTNGAKLNKAWLKLLQHKNFKWLRISLDAATLETWRKIHNPFSGNNLNEIFSLVEYFKDNNINAEIGASFVVNDLNWREIIPFSDLCYNYKFDSVRYTFTYQIKKEKLYHNFKEQVLESLTRVKNKSLPGFHISALTERLEVLQSKVKNYKKCFFFFFSISIGANLKIYPCCMTKYSQKFEIGDISKVGFAEVWSKNLFSFYRNLFAKECPVCWYDRINEMSEYYLTDNPKGQNFIN